MLILLGCSRAWRKLNRKSPTQKVGEITRERYWTWKNYPQSGVTTRFRPSLSVCGPLCSSSSSRTDFRFGRHNACPSREPCKGDGRHVSGCNWPAIFVGPAKNRTVCLTRACERLRAVVSVSENFYDTHEHVLLTCSHVPVSYVNNVLKRPAL